MSKKLITALAILVLIGSTHRSGAQEKVTIDKVVAVVGNSIILYSEVEEVGRQLTDMRRERGYTSDRNLKIEALEELLQQKLLYNQALIDSIDITGSKVRIEEMTEERVGMMVAQAGSVANLEAQFHRPIYDIKREIRYRLEEQQYAQEMRGTLTDKVSVTPGDVDRYFRKLHRDSIPIIPIQYVYAQITKYPLSTSEAKLRAREQLLGLRERIIGGTRFEVLARMYSEDPGTAIRGGEMDPSPLATFDPAFARALEKLRPGQVSEVVESSYGFHIIQLLDKTGELYRMRHILIRPQFTPEEMIATNKMLDSVANVIRNDSMTFEAAAKQFSDDKYSKLNGGLVSNLEMMEVYYGGGNASMATTKHYKEDLQPADFRALENLQPGDISAAFETQDLRGGRMSKIVKLMEIIPSHPANLKEDYLELEQLALRKKSEDEYLLWLDKKIDGMFIRIAPEFRIEQEFNNKSWLK